MNRIVREIAATWSAFSRAERLALCWIAFVVAIAVLTGRNEKAGFAGIIACGLLLFVLIAILIACGLLLLVLIAIPYSIWARGFRKCAIAVIAGTIGVVVYGLLHESAADRFRRIQNEQIERAEIKAK